ncbi:uncharacterized protein Dana_GF26784 [Drosophila ananassae]|uniref:Uncharacterized protein n=1 Tax=Drosophila ananassae TaxID=7217 RepID=A0A0P8Y889_DROAN|nr:uncharacterized protein Dana_GF26784 [Drosophila ananassae]
MSSCTARTLQIKNPYSLLTPSSTIPSNDNNEENESDVTPVVSPMTPSDASQRRPSTSAQSRAVEASPRMSAKPKAQAFNVWRSPEKKSQPKTAAEKQYRLDTEQYPDLGKRMKRSKGAPPPPVVASEPDAGPSTSQNAGRLRGRRGRIIDPPVLGNFLPESVLPPDENSASSSNAAERQAAGSSPVPKVVLARPKVQQQQSEKTPTIAPNSPRRKLPIPRAKEESREVAVQGRDGGGDVEPENAEIPPSQDDEDQGFIIARSRKRRGGIGRVPRWATMSQEFAQKSPEIQSASSNSGRKQQPQVQALPRSPPQQQQQRQLRSRPQAPPQSQLRSPQSPMQERQRPQERPSPRQARQPPQRQPSEQQGRSPQQNRAPPQHSPHKNSHQPQQMQIFKPTPQHQRTPQQQQQQQHQAPVPVRGQPKQPLYAALLRSPQLPSVPRQNTPTPRQPLLQTPPRSPQQSQQRPSPYDLQQVYSQSQQSLQRRPSPYDLQQIYSQPRPLSSSCQINRNLNRNRNLNCNLNRNIPTPKCLATRLCHV